jgi:alpha-1,3-glucan synthase
LTLLTDQSTESATQLYVLSSIYLVTSLVWWIVFRRFQAIYCLSIPFYFYALAFFLIGLPSFPHFSHAREWINNAGTAFYAVASASGSLFFSLNFADEGPLPDLWKLIDCRWCTSEFVGFSRLYDSRDSTNVCDGIMVLGT